MELTIEQALQEGDTAHKEGKLQDAERLFRAVLQSQPLHPDANHNLGVLAVSVNKTDAALRLFKTALEANPKIEQFWLSYIDALIKEKQFDNAKQVIEQAKKQGVDGEKLNILETQLTPTAQVHEPRFAVQNKSLSLSQKRKKLSEQKKRKKAKKQNLKVNTPSQQQLSNLLEYYQNGRFDDAEKLAVSITNEFPQHQFAWKVLGAVLGATGRKSEAVDANQTAVALSPQDAPAHSNLGVALQELGRLDEADASLRQAIALKPDFAEAHYNLGNTLKKLGRLDEAPASYNQAIALKPDYAEAHSNLGNALKELGRLDEAEASLRQAIALKPDYAEAHNNLGITLKELGRLDESIESLKQAIAFKPDYAKARMILNSVVSSAVPVWHLAMMNDEVRNKAYSDALKLAVGDGDVVLDIGTGSGLLSLMAAASGAEKVITCETSRTIAEAAKEIIDINGYREKISVLNKKSTDLKVGVDLPQRADLIISEVFSSEFVGEGVRTTILDANKRLLKKGGRMIPQSGKIRIALIGNSPEIFNNTSVASVHGFDLSKFNSVSQNKFNLKLKDKPVLLSNPEDAFNINLYDESEVVGEEKIIKLRANQNGLCVGLIQWIWIHLYKEIEYENKPGETDSHWITPIYLFDEPVVAKIGDVLEIKAVLGEDYVWFCQLA
ncbi:MAG: tetratricopeptide (TPR) repeat protein [Pseudohongiellaceae bacterium]|jgi:tetratricopeptide (TPR) repeat protein